MKIKFSRAVPDEAQMLSNLAIESKGHWGYSRAQLDAWRSDLRIEDHYIVDHLVRTVVADGEIVGFYAIKEGKGENVIDHLWLLPKAIGRGVGKKAFQKIVEDCQGLGIGQFIIISDPNAEGFYLGQEAIRIGEVKSIPQERMLPKLSYRTKKTQQN